MFALCCEIKIGSISFKSVHDVKVKRSLYDLMATATIKVPVTAVLKHAGEPPTHIETAQAIKVGDKVEIKLGYDGSLNTEFIGYVKRLNYKVPLEIECEDEYYKAAFLELCFLKEGNNAQRLFEHHFNGNPVGRYCWFDAKELRRQQQARQLGAGPSEKGIRAGGVV